jgi:bifunctional DNA-binding transcriptional regulator/antitoxin component of YhaV-PrlF toxin-antitoxin module
MAATVEPIAMQSVRLRAKNQLTLPEHVVRALGVKPGDRLLLVVDGPDRFTIRRSSESAYGMFRGTWGSTPEAIDAHLQELRDEWER